jgi:polyisoprenoid-binding protein YceI
MTTTETKEALPTGTWSADRIHSTAGFELAYMAGTFKGSFAEFDARLSDGVLRGTAPVASVQVTDSNLAASLESPEFFDAERHPELSFEARDVSRSGDDITIAGELTLKGHTEAVEITGHITEPAADPYGGERFGLQLETTVDRTKFGLEWNNQLPNGEPALANEVTISVDLQLVKEG